MTGDLVHYEQARTELAACVRVDEAASIRDKAAKLEAYARMRDDHELEAWVAEIRLRATQRIGELSLELEKSPQASGGRHPNDGKPTKAHALADAGLSTSAAHRAEELAGGPTVNGHKAAIAATDRFFAEAKAGKVVPTMKGLRSAVREAVHAAVPETKPRGKRVKSDPDYNAWLSFVSSIKDVADFEGATFEQMAAVARRVGSLDDNIGEAKTAAKRLTRWLHTLEVDHD